MLKKNSFFRICCFKGFSVFILLIALCTFANSQYCIINEEDTPCQNQANTYQVNGLNLLAGQSLEWEVQGGTFTPLPGPTDLTVEIVWGVQTPPYSVSVIHLDENGTLLGNCTLDVTPGPVGRYPVFLDPPNQSNCPGLQKNLYCNDVTVNVLIQQELPVVNIEWTIEEEISGTTDTSTDYPLSVEGEGIYHVCVTYEDAVTGCSNGEPQCIDFEILSEQAANLEVLDYPGLSGPFTICTNQSLTFLDATREIPGITMMRDWDIYDANDVLYAEGNSINSTFKYEFQEPGIFRVALKKTNCVGCINEDEVIITVVEGMLPQIFCPSIICEGAPETYTTDAGTACNNMTWTALVGNYVVGTGTGTSFTVDWTGWPDSEFNGFGVVVLEVEDCTEGYCQLPVSTVIPIIPLDVDIAGSDFLCDKNANPCYSLPLWPGAFYDWSFTSNGTGFILENEQYNFYCLDFFNFNGTIQIEVEVSHPIAGCLATASMEVTVIDFQIIGPEIICLHDEGTYSLSPPLPPGYSADWTVLNESSMTHCSGNDPQLTCTFNESGDYSVMLMITTPQNEDFLCGDELFEITVSDPVPPFDEIIGQLENVCQGDQLVYSVENNLDDSEVRWDIVSGVVSYSRFGESVTVDWFGPPSSLSVVRILDGCESEPFFVNIEYQGIIDYDLSGPDEVCADAEATYSITPVNSNDPLPAEDKITWSVLPTGAGTVIDDSGASAVIQWHYNTTFPNSEIRVLVDIKNCDGSSVTLEQLVDITAGPNIMIEGQTETCINVTSSYTALVDPLVAGEGTWFLIKNNSMPEQIGTGNTLDYTFPEVGQYLLRFVFQGTGLCPNEYSESIYVNVFLFPDPIITSPDETCSFGPVRLFTQNYEDLGLSVTYEWTDENGVFLGDGPSIVVDGSPGSYTVTVSNGFCTLFDSVSWNCDPPVTCECQNNSEPSIKGFKYRNDCGSIAVSGNLSPESASGFWTVNDPSVPGGGHTETYIDGNVLEYTFENPGFYSVALFAICAFTEPQCTRATSIKVEIPLIADFRWEIACNVMNEETYSYTFIDQSEIMPQATNSEGDLVDVLLTQEWTIDGPGNPPSGTGSSHTVQLLAGETYTITLSGETNVGYGCQKEYTITVPDVPELDISPGLTCSNSLTTFSPGSGLPAEQVASYLWTILDNNGTPFQSFQRTPTFSFPFFGSTEVTLQVETIYGCLLEQTIEVEILGNLKGTLSKEVEECNLSAILTFEPFSTDPSALTYLWSTGETTNPITVNVAGPYHVTVTDPDGNCPPFETFITVNDLPDGEFGLISAPVCEGKQFRVFTQNSPTGLTVEWSTDPPITIVFSNNSFLRGIAPFGVQEILVTATLTDGTLECGSAEIIVPVIPSPQMDLVSTVVNCNPLVIELSDANGLEVEWTDAIGNSLGTGTIEVTEPGTYTASYTSPEGCSTLENITVDPPIDFTPLIFGNYDLCIDELDGTQCAPGIPGTYQSWEWFNPVTAQVYFSNTSSPSEIDQICITPDMEGPIALKVITVNGCEGISDPFFVNLEICDSTCIPDSECTCYLSLDITPMNEAAFELELETPNGVCETITSGGLHYFLLDGNQVEYTLNLLSGTFPSLGIKISGCNLAEEVILDSHNPSFTFNTNAPCPCELLEVSAEAVFTGCIPHQGGSATLFDIIFPGFPLVDIGDITLETSCCNAYSDELLYYDDQDRLHFSGKRTSGLDDLCFTISLGEDCIQEYCIELPVCPLNSCSCIYYFPQSCYSEGNQFSIAMDVIYLSTVNGVATSIHAFNVENPSEEDFGFFSAPDASGNQYSGIEFYGTDINNDGLVSIRIQILGEEGQILCEDLKQFNPAYICDSDELLDFLFTGGESPFGSEGGDEVENRSTDNDGQAAFINANGLLVYPVPAKDFINIYNPSKLHLNIEVLNIDGKVIGRSPDSQDALHVIKSSEFPAGIYLIRVIDKEHNILLSKLVPVVR